MNPTILWVQECRTLWDRDKSKHKEKAVNEISYVVFLHDFRCPYLAYPTNERETRIKKDYFKSADWQPDDAIKAAITKYKELQTSPISRLLQSAMDTCDKMTDYFNGVDFKKVDHNGKPIYTLKEVSSVMKDIGDIVSSLESLKDKVEREHMERGSIRGGSGIGMFER
jgi:Xaa-Pro aminopeptidase